MIPISLLGYAVVSVALLIAVGILAGKRHPRRAASLSLVLIMPVLLWWPIRSVAEYAHLGLTVGLGAGQLGPPFKPDGSDFEAFDWSVGFVGGPNTFLIHDKTDQIALPVTHLTQASIHEDGIAEECAGNVRHLLGHYYVCTF
jgi:hypothetical protein